MKKNIFLLLLLFFSTAAFSYEGIVIVLQASLLKNANEDSTVLQLVRKGEKIFISPSLDLTKALPEYIQTYDRAGNMAFIRSHHVKIITNDLQEEQWPISVGDYDPTDYRIEEPVPASYPFWGHEFKRVSFEFEMGTNPLGLYNYNGTLLDQNFSYERGLRFSVTQKLSFDKSNRYYFGLIGGLANARNTITFTNGNIAEEDRYLFRIGPFFSYDAFRNSSVRLSAGTGITYNYHYTSISVRDTSGGGEQRTFNGFSLSPLASIVLEYNKLIPEVDLVVGSDVHLYLPHSQSGLTSSSSPVVLNGDKIQSSTRAQVSFFIGVQTKY